MPTLENSVFPAIYWKKNSWMDTFPNDINSSEQRGWVHMIRDEIDLKKKYSFNNYS